MAIEHDEDDGPEEDTWVSIYYSIFNRWAEESARFLRALGFQPERWKL